MSRITTKNRGEKGRAPSVQPPLPTRNQDVVDIVPGRLTESDWLSMLCQAEGEIFVADIVDEFMNNVMTKCYEVYLTKQLVPFSVTWAKNAMVQVIEWQYLMHDTGDGADAVSLFQENTEPPPMITDSWAQGCMPMRRIPNSLQGHIIDGEEGDIKYPEEKQGCPSVSKTESRLRNREKIESQVGRM